MTSSFAIDLHRAVSLVVKRVRSVLPSGRAWLFAAASLATGNAQSAVADPVAVSCHEPSGHHVVETTFVCPLGGEEFVGLTLGTYSTYGIYLDFSRVSYLRLPIPLPVCPSNGFVVFKEDFTQKELDRLAEVTSSDAYKALLGKNSSYFLFAYLAEQTALDAVEPWWLYNLASAEIDGCDEALYRRYIPIVIDRAEKQLASTNPDEQVFWVLNIIIANAHRRIGDFAAAREQLGAVLDRYHEQMPQDLAKVVAQLRGHIEAGNSDRQEIEN